MINDKYNFAVTLLLHHPICSIIPPHILKAILREGGEEEQKWALQTMLINERIRGRREVVGSMSAMFQVAGDKERSVYDSHNGQSKPNSKLIRKEGGKPAKDISINEAYDYSGATYDFYKNVFDRNSIDNKGMPLDSYVHWRRNWRNAQWDGSSMLYGDGDGKIFTRFTIAIDVIGHELTHGVTQYEAELEYHDQPGALNESVSDVMGSLVKQYKLKQKANEADWLIGQGIFVDKKNSIRSMKSPGTANPWDDQPSHMKDYKKLPDDEDHDEGGVHINSGIPNHAFYLIAKQIGGEAWKKAGLTWYKTLSSGLSTGASFEEFASHTFVVAGNLFGSNSKEQKAVYKGWDDVGVTINEKPLKVRSKKKRR